MLTVSGSVDTYIRERPLGTNIHISLTRQAQTLVCTEFIVSRILASENKPQ
jgi:hypothetical protein